MVRVSKKLIRGAVDLLNSGAFSKSTLYKRSSDWNKGAGRSLMYRYGFNKYEAETLYALWGNNAARNINELLKPVVAVGADPRDYIYVLKKMVLNEPSGETFQNFAKFNYRRTRTLNLGGVDAAVVGDDRVMNPFSGEVWSIDDARMMLWKVDRTTWGSMLGTQLLAEFDTLSIEEKLYVTGKLMEMDWDSFWKQFYDKDEVNAQGQREMVVGLSMMLSDLIEVPEMVQYVLDRYRRDGEW